MGNLVEHAKLELEALGETDPKIVEPILKIVELFEGMPAPIHTSTLVTKILSRENLTNLTTDPGEWVEVGYGIWQNRRNSGAFSNDGGKHYTLVADKEEFTVPPVYKSVDRNRYAGL